MTQNTFKHGRLVHYTITVQSMNSGLIIKLLEFGTYKKALEYYYEFLKENNITNGSHPCDCEANLEAGGIGYDYRIELLVEEL